MISAFGPRAQAFAKGAGDLEAVIVDTEALGAHAYREAVRRRELGQSFYAMVLTHEPGEQTAAIDEFLSLADATLVRSYAEARRLRARPRAIERVLSEPAVPEVRPSPGARAVAIWSPDLPAADAAWYASALAGFDGDVRFVSPRDPQLGEVLAAAHCVLCPDSGDPGAAVAFARRGFGVAAPFESGAYEYVRDIASFRLGRAPEVAAAVNVASGRPASVRALPRPPAAPARAPLALPAAELPLVSVVLVTYDRPDDLEHCLRDLARQTYPRIEVLVINDAGPNVDHIVARYPQARSIMMAVNGGPLRAIVEGFRIATGSYVQVLADDDTLYPDHIERLMAAMLRSGACVAHGNTLMRYEQRGADGGLRLSGYNAVVFSDTATPSEALVSTPIAGQSLIIRRDVIAAAGGFSIDTALADQELQLRLANRYVFAYVDALTSEWRVRASGENLSSRTDGGAELRRVYEELHPRPDRPLIEKRRTATLELFAGRPKGFIFEPTIRFGGAAR